MVAVSYTEARADAGLFSFYAGTTGMIRRGRVQFSVVCRARMGQLGPPLAPFRAFIVAPFDSCISLIALRQRSLAPRSPGRLFTGAGPGIGVALLRRLAARLINADGAAQVVLSGPVAQPDRAAVS